MGPIDLEFVQLAFFLIGNHQMTLPTSRWAEWSLTFTDYLFVSSFIICVPDLRIAFRKIPLFVVFKAKYDDETFSCAKVISHLYLYTIYVPDYDVISMMF